MHGNDDAAGDTLTDGPSGNGGKSGAGGTTTGGVDGMIGGVNGTETVPAITSTSMSPAFDTFSIDGAGEAGTTTTSLTLTTGAGTLTVTGDGCTVTLTARSEIVARMVAFSLMRSRTDCISVVMTAVNSLELSLQMVCDGTIVRFEMAVRI